jgi:hypothetical protein
MTRWTFRDYITEDHRNPIGDWYGSLDSTARAAFDFLVQDLSGTENWDAPKPSQRKYRILRWGHAGLCELIFNVGRRKFRPLGIVDPAAREFIFLGGCEHRRSGDIPANAFDGAFQLKLAWEQKKGATREHF